MSTPALTPRTNPYAAMLVRSLAETPGVQPEFFSWKMALAGRYDVLHLHWPEAQLRGGDPLKTLVRQVLFLAILVRARLLRVAIVRTVHNLELPREISRRETFVLKVAERWTTLRIRLNETTPIPDGAPYVTIKHGHYRDWFADYRKPQMVPGRIAYVGLIRRYKGVPELARAFAETANMMDGLSLHIGGHPSNEELADRLCAAAAADERVKLCLRRLTDEELVKEVCEAELVVLPYVEMHNSGATLAALSLARPVLVPENGVNHQLAVEVGTGWIFRYSAPLTAKHLTDTLREVRAQPDRVDPNFKSRDWQGSARDHLSAYRRARNLVRRPHLGQ